MAWKLVFGNINVTNYSFRKTTEIVQVIRNEKTLTYFFNQQLTFIDKDMADDRLGLPPPGPGLCFKPFLMT